MIAHIDNACQELAMRNCILLQADGPSCSFNTRQWFEKKGCSRLYRQGALLLLFIVSLGLTGCATSVGVQQNNPRETQAQINISAVNANDYSRFSRDVLIRFNLLETFQEDPQQVLTFLHHEAEKDYRNDLLFALAELHYFTGMRYRPDGINRSQRHFYASAIYAYFYLLGKEWLDAPNPFERRFRMACDLYNGALAEALADADGNLQLVPTQVELPVGRFSYSVDRGGSVRSDSIFCF